MAHTRSLVLEEPDRMTERKASIYGAWPLYLALLLLLLNDYALKPAYPGFLTGKLSDFAGIFLFTLVLRAIVPAHPRRVSLAISGMFAFWKSPYSQSLIDAVNTYGPVEVARVVDYSDLAALLVIPVAHAVFERRDQLQFSERLATWLRIPGILFSVIAITGTSMVMREHRYEIRKRAPDSAIHVGHAVRVIASVAKDNGLACVKCNPSERAGIFENSETTLAYRFVENERGIAFRITGTPGGLLFGEGSREEMEAIKHDLQRCLGREFEHMEYVIRLDGSDYQGW